MQSLTEKAAGDFSSWLRQIRSALSNEEGMEVECGDCVACCSSSQFIHVRPEETQTLARIDEDILVAAPGLPKGHVLLGYDEDGLCPMLADGRCSIYGQRPLTCRIFDCRVFTAAGINAGDDDKALIAQQVRRWKFSYPAGSDREEHLACKAAAKFIQGHAESFPGGKIPGIPSELAILAIKVYGVFLKEEETSAAGRTTLDVEVANAVVDACKKFDAREKP